MSRSASPKNESPSADSQHSSMEEKKDERFQIFLGGSCNPTTWRQTVAIPYLEENGISYYNPQVDNWTPEVVKIERNAKQNAQVLFFVIDRQTRSTVSLVESAYMAGDCKNLVMVIYPFDCDYISRLDTNQHTTSSMIQTSSELTKTNDPRNLSLRILKSSSSSTSTTISTTSQQASGTIRMNNETINLSEFIELKRARFILQSLIDKQNIPVFSDIQQALDHIKRCLTQNISPDKLHAIGNRLLPISSQKNVETHVVGAQKSNRSQNSKSNMDDMKDIYLSVDDDNVNDLESTILYMMDQKGLTYNYRSVTNVIDCKHSESGNLLPNKITSIPLTKNPNENDKCFSTVNGTNTSNNLELEMDAIRSSRVLLFIITDRCRGLSVMVLASHFMALFRDSVVLCIQYLEKSCCIDGECLSETAIADYNRGRVYLGDYAMKAQVPVFRTISEAVECCSRKCGYENRVIKTD